MSHHRRIIRFAQNSLALGLILVVSGACLGYAAPAPTAAAPATSTASAAPSPAATTPAPPTTAASSAPAAIGSLLPYGEFADLQYFLLKGTNQVVLEFYDGSGVTVTDVQCEWQKGGTTPVLQLRIFGQKGGVESKKFFWDTEGNAVYTFDIGAADKSKLRVVYVDDKGVHDIPSAGSLDKPFEPEHPPTPAKGGP
jgi:hypothetical protein